MGKKHSSPSKRTGPSITTIITQKQLLLNTIKMEAKKRAQRDLFEKAKNWIEKGEVRELRNFLGTCPSITEQSDDDGRSLLHYAAQSGR
jgi:hypothetical protein